MTTEDRKENNITSHLICLMCCYTDDFPALQFFVFESYKIL